MAFLFSDVGSSTLGLGFMNENFIGFSAFQLLVFPFMGLNVLFTREHGDDGAEDDWGHSRFRRKSSLCPRQKLI